MCNRGYTPLCLGKCEVCDAKRIKPETLTITLAELESMQNADGDPVDWRTINPNTGLKMSFTCSACEIRQAPKKPDLVLRRKIWCDHCFHLVLCENYDCTICKGYRLTDFEAFTSKYVIETATDLDGNPVNVRLLRKGGTKKLLLECIICADWIKAIPSGITHSTPSGICYKCKKGGHRSGDERMPFENSCASEPIILKLWSEENKFPARLVPLHVDSFQKFHCPDCECRWTRKPANIMTVLGSGIKETFCPCCTDGRVVCGRSEEDCARCWAKSFAAKPMAEFFDYEKNYPLRPNNLTRRSFKKIWMKCPVKHSYLSTPDAERAAYIVCPKCPAHNNKYTEHVFFSWLAKYFDHKNIWRELTIEGCRGKKDGLLRFDGLLLDKIVFEVDGAQHYELDVPRWNSTVESVSKTDRYKEKFAMAEGYSIVRVSQRDIKFDRNNWKENVLMITEKLLVAKNTRQVVKCYEGQITWETYVSELVFDGEQ